MPEAIKSSRELLKLVDQLVKANNLDKALLEVKKARELDPKNLYAFAYEERIQELFAKRKASKESPVKNVKGFDTATGALKPYDINSQLVSKQVDTQDVRIPALYEEFKKAGLRASDRTEHANIKQASKEALDIYKQALLLVWSDGQTTEAEVHELQDLRQALFITTEEHETLDRQAKLECYILLLKHLLQSPGSKAEIAGSLAELRRSFDVSSSDHVVIEANLAALKGTKGVKRTIAVIDDEQQILTLIKEILTQEKYAVEVFSTSDDAYEFLENGRVDLILCDVGLEDSTMNGFLFYEKIRELRHLQQVPFVFITGLNDVVLIRAGKEMGVDDFLIKPIRRENLLATIRGRIKRYEQMKLLAGL
jgi:PleD family two-component response regulator